MPKGESKSELLAVRVAGNDLKQIKAAIALSGKTKPQWIRSSLLKSATHVTN